MKYVISWEEYRIGTFDSKEAALKYGEKVLGPYIMEDAEIVIVGSPSDFALYLSLCG